MSKNYIIYVVLKFLRHFNDLGGNFVHFKIIYVSKRTGNIFITLEMYKQYSTASRLSNSYTYILQNTFAPLSTTLYGATVLLATSVWALSCTYPVYGVINAHVFVCVCVVFTSYLELVDFGYWDHASVWALVSRHDSVTRGTQHSGIPFWTNDFGSTKSCRRVP